MTSNGPDQMNTGQQPRRRSVLVPALFFLSLAIIPPCMYLGHQRSLAALCRQLSRTVGAEVTIRGIWGTLKPSLIIDGLTIGGERPMVAINRVELQLDLGEISRPKISSILLNRPSVALPLIDLSSPDLHQGVTEPPRGVAASSLPALFVEEGAISGTTRHGDRVLSFKISGISYHPGAAARLILGETTVANSMGALVLSSTAVDLTAGGPLPFRRLATLGGTLKLHGRADPGFQIHRFTINANRAGHLIRLQGASPGQGSGQLTLEAQLDRALRPTGRGALDVTLKEVDLTWWAPLIEGFGLRAEKSAVTGTLSVNAADGHLQIGAHLEASGLGFFHPMLATSTVLFPQLKIDGEMSVAPDGELSTERVALRMGKAELQLKGRVHADAQGLRVAVDLSIPRLRCQDLLASTPAAMVPKLRGLALSGEVELKASLVLDSSDLPGARATMRLPELACKVLIDPPAGDVHRLKRALSITVRDPMGRPAELRLGPGNKHFIPYEDLSRSLRRAFIVAEDSHFFRHDGFDQRQLHRAFLNNLEPDNSLRGASTISQQLIKNLFLSHERTLSRKIQEAVLTWRMEQVLPKRRILELYLNMVEMGPGIYGVGHAARTYFNRSATSLGPARAARLAALTPAPRLYAKMLRSLEDHQPLKRRIELLLRLMQRSRAVRAARKKTTTPRLTLLRGETKQ